MSTLSNWLWGVSQLDEAVDKATSELLPAGMEDIALNLEICDQIRSKSVSAKDAMRALKRRLNHTNPNVRNLALGLTDVCVKNGGDLFLVEIASREFMDNLVSILKIPILNLEVKNNILRLVQNWSIAFEGKPSLSYVSTVYKTLTSEGFKFPPKDLSLANSAMVDTQQAPEWINSDVCLRCRTPFSFTNRKHHCRNCGQVFDQQCSSKVLPLPHFGITQDVRVCDSCYPKLTKKNERNDTKGHRHSASLHGTRSRAARDASDADLQRAIQLSLQEVGAVNGRNRAGYTPYQPDPSSWQYSEPPIVDRSTHPKSQAEDDDPDLKAAIEASLRESAAPRPSAPMAIETPRTEEPTFAYKNYSQSYPPAVNPPQPVARVPSHDLAPLESDAILTFSQTVEQVQQQGVRDMSRYPAVNQLYDKANSLRPKLALSLDDAGRKEQVLSEMHDKLSQAVKLYDKLLTEHVVQPRWQSPQPAVNGQYAPYAPQQQQWPQSAPPQQTEQSHYYAQPQQPQFTGSQTQYQAQYAVQQPQYAPSPPVQPYSATPALPPVQQQQYQQAGPSQSMTFAPQPQVAQSSGPSLATYTQSPPPPPQTLQHSSPSAQPTAYSLPQSPVPAQPQYSAPPHSHSPTLSRHNTVAASSSPSATAATYLSRSNTVAAGTHHPVMQRQPSVQHVYQQPTQQYPTVSSPPPAPIQTLPAFPVAPTSTPQTYSMYAPNMIAPTTIPTQKEAAPLIEL
ncbi:Vacuolar protein sorting-associated protein 27 [Mycena indigotica]|uniref:Vacuolar protein sorting-associated protein 27 n=1 Tax=Mycena indigotica TaxID=2126181 RepID=A0A8H6W5A4_9AGAR|nr:Vacuolar protein sorting-associated protein 27 [Mycena indigotica]KAF7306314.1 Vacuolar protein sorting-associated protein 27 [Mycena indigotica]